LQVMKDVYAVAQKHCLPVHMDGARLFNAALSLGIDVKEAAAYCDSVSCCLSKGLCAPVGTIFAGSKALVERARKYRKMLGGGMRQNGILAAAGILALTEMPKRLKEDHENAKHMAKRLSNIDCIEIDVDSVDINIVFFKINKPQSVLDALPGSLAQRGIIMGDYLQGWARFVTSREVNRADVDFAIDVLEELLNAQ